MKRRAPPARRRRPHADAGAGYYRRVRILFLEPFYGGSHREFADGLREHSRHRIDLVSLPARLWKWRLRAAGLTLAQRVPQPQRYDLVVAAGLLDLAQVRAVWGARTPPLLLYLHESQISYPVPGGGSAAAELLWRDVTNFCAADHLVFNSEFHRAAFRARLPEAIAGLPDAEARPEAPADLFDRRSGVLYPGCRFGPGAPPGPPPDPPVVIWNHRWEFDKAPQAFVAALEEAARRGARFGVALLGERLIPEPEALVRARAALAGRIVYDGFPDRPEYLRQLARGSIVVSTALQENFGIAVMEAIHAGCLPLLPRRLVYPELIPAELHDRCLYEDAAGLVERLIRELQAPPADRAQWRRIAARHAWPRVIDAYDDLFETTARA